MNSIPNPSYATPEPRVSNALSVNVEEWFQVDTFSASIPRSSWADLSSRVQASVDRLLTLMAANRTSATFFFPGWLADRHGDLVRNVARAGHEIGSLGYGRMRVNALTQRQFRDDLIHGKAVLEDLSSSEVTGYRAPGFSIGLDTPWAHAIIADCGYRYSSSVYPLRRTHCGAAGAPRFAYRATSALLEIPPSTFRVMGRALPGAGGGYFRLYPYALTRWMIQRINRLELSPVVHYCHPWEIDIEQPRVAQASLRSNLSHHLNLGRTFSRIEQLLRDFDWGRIDDTFSAMILGTGVDRTHPQATVTARRDFELAALPAP